MHKVGALSTDPIVSANCESMRCEEDDGWGEELRGAWGEELRGA